MRERKRKLKMKKYDLNLVLAALKKKYEIMSIILEQSYQNETSLAKIENERLSP